MPKFKVGDEVVPVKIKFPLNTETHRRHGYTEFMGGLMRNGRSMKVYYSSEEKVVAGDLNWHPDDLEFFNLSLENK